MAPPSCAAVQVKRHSPRTAKLHRRRKRCWSAAHRSIHRTPVCREQWHGSRYLRGDATPLLGQRTGACAPSRPMTARRSTPERARGAGAARRRKGQGTFTRAAESPGKKALGAVLRAACSVIRPGVAARGKGLCGGDETSADTGIVSHCPVRPEAPAPGVPEPGRAVTGRHSSAWTATPVSGTARCRWGPLWTCGTLPQGQRSPPTARPSGPNGPEGAFAHAPVRRSRPSAERGRSSQFQSDIKAIDAPVRRNPPRTLPDPRDSTGPPVS